ncbi:MAG: type III secretion system export apparatus subunit SctT [Pseudomonadota bacterium]
MASSALLDIQLFLMALALTGPRAVVMLSLVPGFGGNTLARSTRAAVAFAITLPAVLPTYNFLRDAEAGYLLLMMLGFKEAMVGLMLGVMLAIPMWVAQSVGSILDTQRSPIQISNGNASVDRDASAVGALLVQALVIVMIQAGLFVGVVRILIESYGLWPAYSMAPPFEGVNMEVVMARFGEFLWHVVVYGAPVIIPLMLIDFGMAIIGVFAPNLQVSFMSSPIKSLVGLLVLMLYWPTFSHYVVGDFAHIIDLLPSLLRGGALH